MRYFSLLFFIFFYASSFGQPGNRPGNNDGVSFSYTVRTGCDGDTVVLRNTSHPAPGISNFTWDFGDGSAADNANANPVHVYRKAAKYTITLSYAHDNDPNVRSTYSLAVPVAHPLSAHISVPETSVCWMVPLEFTAADGANLSYSWDLGDGTKATDKEVEYTYPDPGAYTVKLNVTDNKGCAATEQTQVNVVKITAYMNTHDTAVCLKEPMTLRAYAVAEPASVPYTLEWTPANNIANTASAATSFSGVGDYIYTVTASTSYPACNATDTIAIHSFAPVTLTNVTASQTIAQGNNIRLNAAGATYYVWAPANGVLDNPNIHNPVAAPVDPVTKFTVWGMNEAGCLDSASVTITATPSSEIVPSAFTPNGDGLNDIFRISDVAIQKLVDFKVFNRSGKQVFTTTNINSGWDGSWNGAPQEMGVYTYRITVEQKDGTSKTYKGTVTLIR